MAIGIIAVGGTGLAGAIVVKKLYSAYGPKSKKKDDEDEENTGTKSATFNENVITVEEITPNSNLNQGKLTDSSQSLTFHYLKTDSLEIISNLQKK